MLTLDIHSKVQTSEPDATKWNWAEEKSTDKMVQYLESIGWVQKVNLSNRYVDLYSNQYKLSNRYLINLRKLKRKYKTYSYHIIISYLPYGIQTEFNGYFNTEDELNQILTKVNSNLVGNDL